MLHDAQALWPLWLERVGGPASVKAGRRFSHSVLAIDAALDGQGIAIGPAPLAGARINWKFTTHKAREKLARAYPDTTKESKSV